MKLVEEYQDVFSDVTKITHLSEHRIQLTTKEPIRSKALHVALSFDRRSFEQRDW